MFHISIIWNSRISLIFSCLLQHHSIVFGQNYKIMYLSRMAKHYMHDQDVNLYISNEWIKKNRAGTYNSSVNSDWEIGGINPTTVKSTLIVIEIIYIYSRGSLKLVQSGSCVTNSLHLSPSPRLHWHVYVDDALGIQSYNEWVNQN